MNTAFCDTTDIRADFARAMSDMYQQEVPQYSALLELVRTVNNKVLKQQPDIEKALAEQDELTRLDIERHGAIRVGTAEELHTLRRLFRVMGMHPVGYYDLSVAGVPVHATCFRPVDKPELDRNPFRLFTSLLRLDLIENDTLRTKATEILAQRNIFTDATIQLIDRFEKQGGLTQEEAKRFVSQALETFRWHNDTTVDYSTYKALHQEHPLIADIVCFRGPHINHLTPRTLDIDQAQALMPEYGMTPKKLIEGPPARQRAILLRQTSFKALEEQVYFTGETEGHHSARFGEIEQRGIALTPKGRKLYDQLLNEAASAKKDNDNDGYQQALARVFSQFPDNDKQLRSHQLAFYQYKDSGAPIPDNAPLDDAEALVDKGLLISYPIIYEDFLPVSAAGIFHSNLGDADDQTSSGHAQYQQLANALGVEPMDAMALYQHISNESLAGALESIRQRHTSLAQ